jgi:restriction system protein
MTGDTFPYRHEEQTLEEWLNTVLSNTVEERDDGVAFWCFPTDRHTNEYLASVHARSEGEVRLLLRQFLIPSGTLGCDRRLVEEWTKAPKLLDYMLQREFGRRMFRGRPWEGMTWILDLLPHHPQDALNALDAYYLAHMQLMPDGRAQGHEDAASIIRARYLNQIHPADVLSGLNDRDFEFLIASLYRKLGYVVEVTSATRDGGCDVRASRAQDGRAEKLLIECKLHSAKLGEKEVRSLAGLVDAENANKGVIVAPGGFSRPSTRFAAKVGRIELIDYGKLNRLLNEAHGSEWHLHLGSAVAFQKRRDRV